MEQQIIKKSTEGSLIEEAKAISSILLDVQESLKVLEYLITFDPVIDVYNKNRELFWQFTAVVYAEHALLKLSILANPQEHFSINGLLNKLRIGGEFESAVDKEILKEWTSTYKRLYSTIKKILLRRNKFIAHRDRSAKNDPMFEISLKEIKMLISLCQKVVKELFLVVNGSAFHIDDPIGSPIKNLKTIMKSLNEQKISELAPLFSEARRYGLSGELPESQQK